MQNLIPHLIGPLACLILLTACAPATQTERELDANARSVQVTDSDGLDCQEAVMFFPRAIGELQNQLPAGFQARHIRGLIDETAAPQTSGQGAVFFNVVRWWTPKVNTSASPLQPRRPPLTAAKSWPGCGA